MNFVSLFIRLSLVALFIGSASAQSRASRKEKPVDVSGQMSSFAPLPEGHELASLWNDPGFTRRLIGSYGFESDVEPRLTPEEQAAYRDKVVPLLREDPKKAIPVLESMAKPAASAVFDFTLGNVLFQTEDLTNAIRHFETALTKFPDFRRAQKNLAFARMRNGEYAEAIQSLVRTIALGGGDGRVFALLGFAYLNQGRHASAEAAYRQALIFEPDNVDYRLALVKSAVATANYDYALGLLDELIQQHPDRDTLWSLRANLFIQKEQPARAAISLEMLRRLGKAAPQHLFLLGDLYMARDARDLAVAAYLEGVERDDGRQVAKALRAGEILVSRGAFDEARTLFARLRETRETGLSEADRMKLLRLESKVAMATGDGDKAIQTLEEIIGKNPLDGEALLLAGDYYAKHDQREKAGFRYQTAASLENFKADAWVKHAQLLVQEKKYNDAVELLKKAQKFKPREHIQRYLEKVEVVAGRSTRT